MRPVGCAGAPHYIIPHLRKNVKYFDKNILRPVGSRLRRWRRALYPRPVGSSRALYAGTYAAYAGVLSGRRRVEYLNIRSTQHTASCRVRRHIIRRDTQEGAPRPGPGFQLPQTTQQNFNYRYLRSKKKKKKKVSPFIIPQILRFVNSFDKNFLKNIFGKILDILLKI